MLDGYYYCLNCHSEITPDYNEHCTFCGCSAIAVSGDYSTEEVERAFDLLNKEQQGLVIVPPCKVGDTVYMLNVHSVIERKVAGFQYLKDMTKLKGIIIDLIIDKKGHTKATFFSADKINKCIFFTREEAEKALKERCGK